MITDFDRQNSLEEVRTVFALYPRPALGDALVSMSASVPCL